MNRAIILISICCLLVATNALTINITELVMEAKISWDKLPAEKRQKIGFLSNDLLKLGTESFINTFDLTLFCPGMLCIDISRGLGEYMKSFEDHLNIVF